MPESTTGSASSGPPLVDDKAIAQIAALIAAELGKNLALHVVKIVAEEHTGGNWKKQIKIIIANLKDKANPDFKSSVLNGEFTPAQLADLPSSGMASKKLKRQREQIEKASLLARLDTESYNAAVGSEIADGVVPCVNCGSMKTSFAIVALSVDRDAVEYVSCSACGHHWKN